LAASRLHGAVTIPPDCEKHSGEPLSTYLTHQPLDPHPQLDVHSGAPVLEAPSTYEIEFYEDDQGHEPALAFMQSLPGPKRRAIGVAINEFLRYLGSDVVRTDFGKSLGEGLYEFRVDQDAEQTLRKAGKNPKPEPERQKILLRVFFHPHGNKLLLLLSGYDKAEHSSKPHQNAQIEEARRLLRHWKERQKKRH
jgi:putative component of toxin-antitoxin plasmid stabilization module